MMQCPLCSSVRVVLVLSGDRRAFCGSCGTRWIQDGSEQRAIQRPQPPDLPNEAATSSPAS